MEVSVRLVGSAAFKAVGTSDPRPAGSIPVHLRQFVRRRMRALISCVFGFLMVFPVGVASADPARPGNTESIVESVDPQVDGVRIDVVGGDAFMRVRVQRGHELAASGYQHEPFFKVDRDGGVWVNEWSSTVALSAQRYGATDDAAVTPTTSNVPEWRLVGRNGTYLWHDHRIHWMSPTVPPTLNVEGLVQQWSIPFTVDGTVIAVSGGLYLRQSPGTWWWLLVVPLVVCGVLLTRRFRAPAVGVAAASLVFVGGLSHWGLPTEARGAPTLFVLGLVGVSIAVVARLMHRQGEVVDALVASAGVATVVGVVLARAMVTHRFVPGLDNPWWVRATLPVVGGLAVGAVVASLRTLLGKN